MTIRRKSTLSNPDTGAAPVLRVVGITALGATAITLDDTGLKGTMAKGAAFTLPADATVYTTTAAVTADADALTDIPINALTAEAANNALATVTQSYGEVTYKATRSNFRADEFSGDIKLGDFKLEVVTSEELEDLKDGAVIFDGDTLAVVDVMPHSPGNAQAVTVLHVRGAV
ncbi:MAG: hypothetical protein KJO44_10910 [Gemmatimonadetes bacterium]|nr:hypothetical protein [Gemmatimonadota bacterium]